MADEAHYLVYDGPALPRQALLQAAASLWDWHVCLCAPRKGEQLQVEGGVVVRSPTPRPHTLELAVLLNPPTEHKDHAFPPPYSVVQVLAHEDAKVRIAWRSQTFSPKQAVVPLSSLWAFTSVYARPKQRELPYSGLIALLGRCRVVACRPYITAALAGAAVVRSTGAGQRFVRTGDAQILDVDRPLISTAQSSPQLSQLIVRSAGHHSEGVRE